MVQRSASTTTERMLIKSIVINGINYQPQVVKHRDFWTPSTLYGVFQKWWYPTTMGFPTKNDHFGVFWGTTIFGNTYKLPRPTSSVFVQRKKFASSRVFQGQFTTKAAPSRAWRGSWLNILILPLRIPRVGLMVWIPSPEYDCRYNPFLRTYLDAEGTMGYNQGSHQK